MADRPTVPGFAERAEIAETNVIDPLLLRYERLSWASEKWVQNFPANPVLRSAEVNVSKEPAPLPPLRAITK